MFISYTYQKPYILGLPLGRTIILDKIYTIATVTNTMYIHFSFFRPLVNKSESF